jgi:hypothetical protein
MNDTVGRISEEAKASLKSIREQIENSVRSAREVVLEAEKSLDAVVGVTRDFPDKLLTKYTFAATGEIKVDQDHGMIFNQMLLLNSYQYPLVGLFGADVKRGKYRVLVLLEKVE